MENTANITVGQISAMGRVVEAYNKGEIGAVPSEEVFARYNKM